MVAMSEVSLLIGALELVEDESWDVADSSRHANCAVAPQLEGLAGLGSWLSEPAG